MNKFIRWSKDLFFERNLEQNMQDFKRRLQRAQDNVDKLTRAIQSTPITSKSKSTLTAEELHKLFLHAFENTNLLENSIPLENHIYRLVDPITGKHPLDSYFCLRCNRIIDILTHKHEKD